MDTFKDEIKNIKMLTRVIAVAVLVNFAILALLVGPDSVGFDPTYGPITAILNFVIAFCTSAEFRIPFNMILPDHTFFNSSIIGQSKTPPNLLPA